MTAKPDMTYAWGESSALISEPNDTKKQTGWIVEKPPVEWMNWLQNRMDTFLKHINERGIPQWDATTTYVQGGKAYASDYKTYVSQQSNSGHDPTTDSGTYWKEDIALKVTTAIKNYYSQGGTSPHTYQANFDRLSNTNHIACGALSAGVYKTIFSYTGEGALKLCYATDSAYAGTTYNLSVKITLDGTQVFEGTANGIASTWWGLHALGSLTYGQFLVPNGLEYFSTSALIEVKSSIATSTVILGLSYEEY